MVIPSTSVSTLFPNAFVPSRPSRSFEDIAENHAASTAAFSLDAATRAERRPVAAPSRPPTASATSEAVLLDTDQGRIRLDVDAYFSNRSFSSSEGLPPLLLPTEGNLEALTGHLDAAFPRFLSENGIPEAPSRVTYDRMGKIQLPDDYPYASQLEKALEKDPVMAREISTVHAIASVMADVRKSMAFQEEYRAATTQAQLDAVLAKYDTLLSGADRPADIALTFSESGHPTATANGRPLLADPGTGS